MSEAREWFMHPDSKQEIEAIVADHPNAEVFIGVLDQMLGIFSGPGSFYAREDVREPRSAKLRKMMEKKIARLRSAKGVGQDLPQLAVRPEESAEFDDLDRILDQAISTLSEVRERVRPRGMESRLRRERSALFGLMWIVTKHLDYKISPKERSRFYLIAEIMFRELDYEKQDYAWLIKEVRLIFQKLTEIDPVSSHDSTIMPIPFDFDDFA